MLTCRSICKCLHAHHTYSHARDCPHYLFIILCYIMLCCMHAYECFCACTQMHQMTHRASYHLHIIGIFHTYTIWNTHLCIYICKYIAIVYCAYLCLRIRTHVCKYMNVLFNTVVWTHTSVSRNTMHPSICKTYARSSIVTWSISYYFVLPLHGITLHYITYIVWDCIASCCVALRCVA